MPPGFKANFFLKIFLVQSESKQFNIISFFLPTDLGTTEWHTDITYCFDLQDPTNK